MRRSMGIIVWLALAGCGAAGTSAPSTAPAARSTEAGSTTNAPPPETPWTWPELRASEVEVVEVTPLDGETIRFERHGDGWLVTSPVHGPADPDHVDALLSRLELLGPPVAYSDDPIEPPRIPEPALADPVRVVVRGAGTTLADVEIGGMRDGATQIRAHGTTTFAWADGSWRFAVARELRDWREHGLFADHDDDMSRIVWEVAGARLEITERDNRFVDAHGVEPASAVVRAIGRLRVEDFADVSLAEAGIEPTSDRVTVDFAGGGTRTIVLGDPVGEDGAFYAAIDGQPTVYVLSARSAAAVRVTADVLANGFPEPAEPAPSLDEIPPEIRRALEEALRARAASDQEP